MSSDKAGGWGALKSSFGFLKREGCLKGLKTLLKMNQPDGFDCPGCAWPDPKDPSTFEFCENGVKALTWETTKKRADRTVFAQYTVSELIEKDDFFLEGLGRLTEPFRYNADSDKYIPCTWDDAFDLISAELNACSSPDEAIFYTSGRTSNEAAFLYQLLGRMYGTNNFPDCSNMCHESSGVAMSESIGIGKGTVLLDDFEKADAIFIMGQNPGTNHPRMLTELQKAAKRGATIACFNPLKEAGLLNFLHPQHASAMLTNTGTPIATHYYQLKIGGDQAAMKGIMKIIFEKDPDAATLDQSFINEHCHDFDAFRKHIIAADWDLILEQSGLSKEQLEEAAEVYLKSEKTIICWAMGITQHRHAVATIQDIVNLLLLKGNLGRAGAGACPVRGHSNVQGDRTVGITEKPNAAFLDALEKHFSFKAPREHGLDVVESIKAMHEKRASVFIGMGGNFAAATPDTAYTESALKNCKLTCHVSTHLNRSHLIHGEKALILPCLTRSETDIQNNEPQAVSVEDSMSMVHLSTGKNAPASDQLLSEVAIVCELGKRLFPEKTNWQTFNNDYSSIRDSIAACIPMFKDYNKKVNRPGGFHLRNSARERDWQTPTGKANFMINELIDLDYGDAKFCLMTVRSHDQYNTTIYGKDDRYRGISGERKVLFINKNDMTEAGFKEGERVNIINEEDGESRQVSGFKLVPYDIPRGCLAAYFPETNPLVGINKVAKKSNTPMSKFIPVRIETGR